MLAKRLSNFEDLRLKKRPFDTNLDFMRDTSYYGKNLENETFRVKWRLFRQFGTQ